MSVLDKMLEGAREREGSPVNVGWSMANDALEVLRQIRDHTGEGASERTQYLTRTVGVDIAGGGGEATIRLPAGVGWRLSSFAASLPGINGWLTVWINGDLLKLINLPGGGTGSGFYITGEFGPDDYMPENSSIRLLFENVGADGHAIFTIRGKAFLPGEPVTLSVPQDTDFDGADYGDNGPGEDD